MAAMSQCQRFLLVFFHNLARLEKGVICKAGGEKAGSGHFPPGMARPIWQEDGIQDNPVFAQGYSVDNKADF
jgi:hypothetical protein